MNLSYGKPQDKFIGKSAEADLEKLKKLRSHRR